MRSEIQHFQNKNAENRKQRTSFQEWGVKYNDLQKRDTEEYSQSVDVRNSRLSNLYLKHC